MVGGHPYLVRVALYHLARELTLNKLLQEAPTLAGIYSHHLASSQICKHIRASSSTQTGGYSSASVQLEAITAYKPESMGLVKLENQATPCCELYRLYFREQLGWG